MATGLPHARGGVSLSGTNTGDQTLSSPRSWGCFLTAARKEQEQQVFPTLVGVFLYAPTVRRGVIRLPHARGGVSQACRTAQYLQKVFPTLVGVFHLRLGHCLDGVGLPHARGGVSRPRNQKGLVHTSSPRSWGCFYLSGLAEEGETVFPTLVGVFP